jgi:serine O-acetyltransferase
MFYGLINLVRYLKSDFRRIQEFRNTSGLISSLAILFSAALHVAIIIRLIRFFHSCIILKPISKILQIYLLVSFGVIYSPKIEIGEGLFLPHPMNIVIGCFSLGSNVTIMQGVTLGASRLDSGFSIDLRPTIGNNVFIGVNSVILGGGEIKNSEVIRSGLVISL